jgi:hypothetical protein
MKRYGRRLDRCVGATLRSPGRLREARRENCRQFWRAIASGRSGGPGGKMADVKSLFGGNRPKNWLHPSFQLLRASPRNKSNGERPSQWRRQKAG